jgi:hypothetical protein
MKTMNVKNLLKHSTLPVALLLAMSLPAHAEDNAGADNSAPPPEAEVVQGVETPQAPSKEDAVDMPQSAGKEEAADMAQTPGRDDALAPVDNQTESTNADAKAANEAKDELYNGGAHEPERSASYSAPAKSHHKKKPMTAKENLAQQKKVQKEAKKNLAKFEQQERQKDKELKKIKKTIAASEANIAAAKKQRKKIEASLKTLEKQRVALQKSLKKTTALIAKETKKGKNSGRVPASYN